MQVLRHAETIRNLHTADTAKSILDDTIKQQIEARERAEATLVSLLAFGGFLKYILQQPKRTHEWVDSPQVSVDFDVNPSASKLNFRWCLHMLLELLEPLSSSNSL